jgi:hypothetical protein
MALRLRLPVGMEDSMKSRFSTETAAARTAHVLSRIRALKQKGASFDEALDELIALERDSAEVMKPVCELESRRRGARVRAGQPQVGRRSINPRRNDMQQSAFATEYEQPDVLRDICRGLVTTIVHLRETIEMYELELFSGQHETRHEEDPGFEGREGSDCEQRIRSRQP